MPHTLISAAHKSSGKTTICIGLCAALRQRNLKVQPFKKGPDYIDPMWLTQAAGKACHNLDFYTQSHNEIRTNFYQSLNDADIGLIEGNKGLYDGLAIDGSNSNAALSVLLGAPVVLVIDTSGMTRGIAPLLLGYQAFDTNVNIAGVILNKVNGARHEKKLRQVIQHYTNLPVIGAIPRNKELEIIERHLGLMPSNESSESNAHIASIRTIIEQQIDLELLQRIAATATPIALPALTAYEPCNSDLIAVRIGIATGAAFGFYYPADLEAMERYGAKLIPFDPLIDTKLPAVDGIFIGGGFPESFMQQLEANVSMRKNIAECIEAGIPVYAECGGLMYLSRSITWKGQTHAMVGIIPANTVMHDRPQGRGYMHLKPTAEHNWPTNQIEREIFAHEFHYSSLEQLAPGQKFAFEVLRGDGIDGKHDGIVYKNLLAGYAHLRDVAGYNWTRHFLNHVRNCIVKIH